MREHDTSLGANHPGFEATNWGRILETRRGDGAATRDLMESLARTYWRPIYEYIRVAWRKGNEEAKDLTQDFFAAVFRLEFLARADPARGRFRTFVLASVRNFLRDQEKHRRAAVRGGEVLHLPLEAIERETLPASDLDPEAAFRRSWAESLLSAALGELERTLAARGRQASFNVFRSYSLERAPGGDVSYESLALKLGLSISQVTNYLYESKNELRSILLGMVESTLTSREDAEEELRTIFGI